MNNECASSCAEDHPCGAQDPPRANKTTSSAMSVSATGGSSDPTIFNGMGGDGATGSSKPAGNAAPALAHFGSAYGLFVVAAGVVGGVAVML
jgi:hypothetical protein